MPQSSTSLSSTLTLSPLVERLIRLAIEEDIGSGDITSQEFIPPDTLACARIVARENCIFAGNFIVDSILNQVDERLSAIFFVKDGDSLIKGQSAIEVKGPARAILSAERTLLNFLQHLTAIATTTRRYIDEIKGTTARLLDTRKTTPGWRELEKAAVLAGGGKNHRMGLYDMAMLKDNHLAAQSSHEALAKNLLAFRKKYPDIPIEIEADTLEQVRFFAGLPEVDFILLDNMPPAQIREALKHRREGLCFEASGGITLKTIRSIAETGVDFISIGALTHSATSVDLGMDWKN
ncbi:MAG: carboxylating nicotinate-nucleotide diphosphorylase [Chthoniobacterales bacterium]